jgi:hypothetical protein
LARPEACSAKKKHRDAASYTGYETTVVEELGDVLWYLTIVGARAGLSLAEIALNRNSTFADWQTNHTDPLPFAALQPQEMHVQAQPSPAYETTLLKLAGEVGLLVTDHQADRLRDNRAAVAGRLIPIFRTLIQAANEAWVSLNDAAAANITKIFDRWPQRRVYPPLFDETYEVYEQLPRTPKHLSV